MREEKSYDSSGKEKNVELKLRKAVFFPPWLLLIAMVVISLVNGEAFLAGLNAVTSWILKNFSWLFNSVTVMCVVTVIVVYFSPLGKVRIGGSKAHPKMKFLDLVWITLCTTIAAGILFWACAEPLTIYMHRRHLRCKGRITGRCDICNEDNVPGVDMVTVCNLYSGSSGVCVCIL